MFRIMGNVGCIISSIEWISHGLSRGGSRFSDKQVGLSAASSFSNLNHPSMTMDMSVPMSGKTEMGWQWMATA